MNENSKLGHCSVIIIAGYNHKIKKYGEAKGHLMSFELANISCYLTFSVLTIKAWNLCLYRFKKSHGAPICTLFVESAITFMICGMGKAQGGKADG